MKSAHIQAKPNQIITKLEAWKDQGYNLAILFAPRETIEDETVLSAIKKSLPDTEIVGCSTSGEIGDGVDDGSVSILGMKFEHSRFKITAVEISGADNSRQAGKAVADKLAADDLKGVFVLLPGVDVNGSKFTQGIKENLPDAISISGGLAGDGLSFGATKTFHNTQIYNNYVIGIGFYGDALHISSDARGGWKTFGPLRRVTKAENNVLYELDGKSALALYKEYLGEKASDLPSSGLLYPFAIMDEQGNASTGLIRTILNIDEENGSLVLAGDMEVGQKICLMHANTDQLVEGAGDAANNLDAPDKHNAAVICVSCVGRKILMGDDTEDELDAIRDVMGESIPMTGFYSYGEICFFDGTKQTELHNQTMTLTYITEKAA